MRTTTILAIDTASPSPAVTLLSRGSAFDQRLPLDRQASEQLLPTIAECLARAGCAIGEIGRIAVCSGPGSFTGVRVGLATAWGLARSLGCPVETVSTLDALAEAARSPGLAAVAAAMDAGRGEIVWQPFDLTGERARATDTAQRVKVEAAREAFRGLMAAYLPADLLGPNDGSRAVTEPLSGALAAAVERAPAGPVSPHLAAIYSRPSAAEEKRGSA